MRYVNGFIAVNLAALAVVPATAQAPALANKSLECELHFWGSGDALTSNYSGVDGFAGALLAGPSPQNREGLAGDLPISAQADALEAIDLAALLKMPAVRVIAEREVIDRKLVKSSKLRLTQSQAPCYAELIVDYIGYTSHITAGRKFGARFWLRRYPHENGRVLIQNGGKDVKVRIYPAKMPEDQPAALAELRVAFGKVVEGFLLNKVK
jgi:hypothetical protein